MFLTKFVCLGGNRSILIFQFCCQCFRHSDLQNDRPSTIQFKEKLPWFLNALPSNDCAKGGHGAYTSSVEFKGLFMEYCASTMTSLSKRLICFQVKLPLPVACYLNLRFNNFIIFLLSGDESGMIQASSFRTYHTPLNKQVSHLWSIKKDFHFPSFLGFNTKVSP